VYVLQFLVLPPKRPKVAITGGIAHTKKSGTDHAHNNFLTGKFNGELAVVVLKEIQADFVPIEQLIVNLQPGANPSFLYLFDTVNL
jgi:hypothetical protein